MLFTFNHKNKIKKKLIFINYCCLSLLILIFLEFFFKINLFFILFFLLKHLWCLLAFLSKKNVNLKANTSRFITIYFPEQVTVTNFNNNKEKFLIMSLTCIRLILRIYISNVKMFSFLIIYYLFSNCKIKLTINLWKTLFSILCKWKPFTSYWLLNIWDNWLKYYNLSFYIIIEKFILWNNFIYEKNKNKSIHNFLGKIITEDINKCNDFEFILENYELIKIDLINNINFTDKFGRLNFFRYMLISDEKTLIVLTSYYWLPLIEVLLLKIKKYLEYKNIRVKDENLIYFEKPNTPYNVVFGINLICNDDEWIEFCNLYPFIYTNNTFF